MGFHFFKPKERRYCGKCRKHVAERKVCWTTGETRWAHSEACGAFDELPEPTGMGGSRKLTELPEHEMIAIIKARAEQHDRPKAEAGTPYAPRYTRRSQ